MLVILKSLEELKEEYDVEKILDDYIVYNSVIYSDMLYLLGKVVEARYDKKSDSYVIDGWYFDPNIIKGEVIDEKINYKIKRLNDGLVMTYYIHNKGKVD